MAAHRLPMCIVTRVSIKEKWTPSKMRVVSEAIISTKVNGLLLWERS